MNIISDLEENIPHQISFAEESPQNTYTLFERIIYVSDRGDTHT